MHSQIATRLLQRMLFIDLILAFSCLLCSFHRHQNKDKEMRLVFSIQPSNGFPAGTTEGTLAPITISIVDEKGNVIPCNTQITIAIAHNPGKNLRFLRVIPIQGKPATGKGIFEGLLTGTRSVRAVNGIATFNDLGITQPGRGYTFVARAKRMRSTISQPFHILASKAGYEKTSNSEGLEIADLTQVGSNFQGYVDVYITQPPNAISQSAFESWSQSGWIKNSTRHAIFNYQRVRGSPNTPQGNLTVYTDNYGYTWGYIAQIQSADWPFHPDNYPPPEPTSAWEAGATTVDVPAGVVKYSSINKNQLYIYQAADSDTQQPILCYFLTDAWGNEYIMKSSNQTNNTPDKILAAFESAILPVGWGKSIGYLPQDFYGYPVQNDLIQAYQDFRDNADNAYTEIVWGKKGKSIPQQIGYPMPIYASSLGARVNGNNGGQSLMYGGPSNDRFYPEAGENAIDGGTGINGVFYPAKSHRYKIISRGLTTYVKKEHEMFDTLTNIQYIHFKNQVIWIQP